MNPICAAAAWTAAFMIAVPGAHGQEPTAFEHAMQAYELQHFDDAFGALARLADDGHADAARIALLMAAHGPRLFKQRFELTTARRDRWLDSATRAPAQRVAG